MSGEEDMVLSHIQAAGNLGASLPVRSMCSSFSCNLTVGIVSRYLDETSQGQD